MQELLGTIRRIKPFPRRIAAQTEDSKAHRTIESPRHVLDILLRQELTRFIREVHIGPMPEARMDTNHPASGF